MPFEGLCETLLRGGVAPRHVRRYLRELDDHLADLTEAQRIAGYDPANAAIRAQAQLGSEAELVAAMLAQPSLRTLAARAPWLVFGLLPPLAALAAFFLAALPLAIIVKTQGMILGHAIAAPVGFRLFAHGVEIASDLLLGPLLAALLVAAALRQRMTGLWPGIGVAVIALLGMHIQVMFPEAGRHGGHLEIAPALLMIWHLDPGHWPLLAAQLFLTLLPAAGLAGFRGPG